ncbi:Cobalt/magnesium transport protein CorA [bioreactor metagenome]|uniref:Cobalt/magnesium transport protein CorA n=1 Tax=bioreactor metagenome TaxID=1076179 RepID=A0A644XIK2_9ZZZZ
MIRCLQFSISSKSFAEIKLTDIDLSQPDPDKLLWVSLESTTDTEIYEVLDQKFHFHPLAIEDCLSNDYQIAKVDDYKDYIFMIINALKPDREFHELETQEVDIFLGQNFVVSCFSAKNLPPVEKVIYKFQRDSRVYTHGPDFICHALVDSIVDEYLPVIDKMEMEIEWLEDSVLEKPNPETLAQLLRLKHSIMSLRRVITPLREVINKLARDEYPQIEAQMRLYFRDIYDHVIWVLDISDTIRDIVSGALDIYLNSTSLRLNEVMKALTIVSTIFLPLSFVASVFGMNFRFMPWIDSTSGFLLVNLVFFAISVGMLIFFKFRKWF